MFLQSFMNFGGRLIIFQVLHVQWQRSARSVAVQGTFSGCPRNVQWLSKARSAAVQGTFSGCPKHVQWLPMERSMERSMERISWNMVNFAVFLRIFVRFQLVFPILTCSDISWQNIRFSVIFEFFRI